MRAIIAAEIAYNRKLFIGCLALMMLVCFYEILIDEERIGYVLIVTYMLTTFWNIYRNKEKRDYRLASLPVSSRKIGLSRIVMIALAGIGIAIFYALVHMALQQQAPRQPVKLISYLGIILCGFSIYYFIRDNWVATGRTARLTLRDFRAIIILAIIGFNLLLAWAIMQSKATGAVHPIISVLDKVNVLADPPGEVYQIVLFALCSLGFALMTVHTYGRRHSYLK